jgi:hypothetical protein
MYTGGEASVSNHSRVRFLVVLLFAAFAAAALVSADIGALAQNANGSTTGGESAQNSNANMMGATRRGRRGRRGRRWRRGRGRRASTAAAVAAAEGGAMIDPNGGAAQSGDVSGEQTDLSGTYTGHMTMTGGHEMSGEVTLTVTGNTFTITGEGMTHNGRVYAVTTRGYTGASFYFSDITNPSTNTPVVATVRARKRGDAGLWLSPVPGTQTRLTFGTGGGGGGRRGGRRARRSETMTAPSPEATGDATGDASAAGGASGDATTTPRRRRGGRRARRRATTTNTNANTGDNSNATPPR